MDGRPGERSRPWLSGLYDAPGMAAADRYAIETAGIPSLELMEAAGRGVARAAAERAEDGPVRVVCGKGNNGGDGLVAARHLAQSGFEVEVLLLWPAAELSPDASASLERLERSPRVRVLEGAEPEPALAGSGAVVDAVFGTGFAGEAREPASAAIEAMASCEAPLVACDVPSGVDASTGEAVSAAPADVTVTFHGLKLGHVVAPAKHLCGEVEVVPIGIPAEAPRGVAGGLITPAVLDEPLRRAASSNKFTSGQVVIAGGSRGLTGAVCLAAMGAVRAGAGYATVAVPAALEGIFEVKLTEVMSIGCGGDAGHLELDAAERIAGASSRAAAVVLGSGLGRERTSLELVRELMRRVEAPVVLDADGLSAYSGDAAAIAADREAPTVLTPHEGEMGRLLGVDSAEVAAHRLGAARRLAELSGATVVLKGDDTIVAEASEPRVAVNDLAAPALATAGTGDVLAGMCGAFLARCPDPFAAACAAVHAHTRAGIVAGARVGNPDGVIAGDVVEAIPAGTLPARPVE